MTAGVSQQEPWRRSVQSHGQLYIFRQCVHMRAVRTCGMCVETSGRRRREAGCARAAARNIGGRRRRDGSSQRQDDGGMYCCAALGFGALLVLTGSLVSCGSWRHGPRQMGSETRRRAQVTSTRPKTSAACPDRLEPRAPNAFTSRIYSSVGFSAPDSVGPRMLDHAESLAAELPQRLSTYPTQLLGARTATNRSRGREDPRR